MVKGKEVNLNEFTYLAKIIHGGRDVIFTRGQGSGSGGFENEGESLWIYNVGSKGKRKIFSSYHMLEAIRTVKLSNGKTAIIIRSVGTGVYGSVISVIDPTRGEVFSKESAEAVNIKGDLLTLSLLEGISDDLYSKTVETELKRKDNFFLIDPLLKNTKKEKFNLKNIIENNEVIFNESYMSKYYSNNVVLKRVLIYLWRYNDNFKNKDYVLAPVPRYVNPKAPLKPTLEALFGKVEKDEADYGMGNPTFGMKFEGVVLKNGTATVRFSQPKNQTNHGTLAPFIFEDAIKKTALQFPAVKRVKVCAIGKTLIDAQLDNQFPRCSN